MLEIHVFTHACLCTCTHTPLILTYLYIYAHTHTFLRHHLVHMFTYLHTHTLKHFCKSLGGIHQAFTQCHVFTSCVHVYVPFHPHTPHTHTHTLAIAHCCPESPAAAGGCLLSLIVAQCLPLLLTVAQHLLQLAGGFCCR